MTGRAKKPRSTRRVGVRNALPKPSGWRRSGRDQHRLRLSHERACAPNRHSLSCRAKRPLAILPPERRLRSKINGVETDVKLVTSLCRRPYATAAVLQPGLSIGNVPRVRWHARPVRAIAATMRLVCEQLACCAVVSRRRATRSATGLTSGPNVSREVAHLRRWIDPPRQFDAAIAAIDRALRSINPAR